jgi:hypothetical protein
MRTPSIRDPKQSWGRAIDELDQVAEIDEDQDSENSRITNADDGMEGREHAVHGKQSGRTNQRGRYRADGVEVTRDASIKF